MLKILALAVVLFTAACNTEPDRSFWFIESYHDGVLTARLDEGPGRIATYVAVCDGQNQQALMRTIARITESGSSIQQGSSALPMSDSPLQISPTPDSTLQISPTHPLPGQTMRGCDIVAGYVGKGIPVEGQERDSYGGVVITTLTTRGEQSGGSPGDSLILHGKRGGFSETFRIVSVTR